MAEADPASNPGYRSAMTRVGATALGRSDGMDTPSQYTLEDVLSGRVQSGDDAAIAAKNAGVSTPDIQQMLMSMYPGNSNIANLITGLQMIGPIMPALLGAGGLATGAAGQAAGAGAGAAAGGSFATNALGDLVYTALPNSGGALGSALGALGSGALASMPEITVTGAKPSPSFGGSAAFPTIAGGGVDITVPRSGSGGGMDAPAPLSDLAGLVNPANPQPIADTQGPLSEGPEVNQPGKMDWNTIKQILNGGGHAPGGGNAGATGSSTPAATPAMTGMSPFGGGGAGVGPAGLAVKGSTAPDIYPWSQAAKKIA